MLPVSDVHPLLARFLKEHSNAVGCFFPFVIPHFAHKLSWVPIFLNCRTNALKSVRQRLVHVFLHLCEDCLSATMCPQLQASMESRLKTNMADFLVEVYIY